MLVTFAGDGDLLFQVDYLVIDRISGSGFLRGRYTRVHGTWDFATCRVKHILSLPTNTGIFPARVS